MTGRITRSGRQPAITWSGRERAQRASRQLEWKMSDDLIRASDQDRERIVSVLGEHLAAGRLTMAEFEERAGTAYAARTLGDLDGLLVDLPKPQGRLEHPRPAAAASRVSPRRSTAARWQAAGHPLAGWALTAVICLGIWVVTSAVAGQALYFWPVWVIGPWGAMLVRQLAFGRRPCGSASPRGRT